MIVTSHSVLLSTGYSPRHENIATQIKGDRRYIRKSNVKDGPTLPFLLHFPGKNGFIDIPAEIGNHYALFGTFLLKDNYGYILRDIEEYI